MAINIKWGVVGSGGIARRRTIPEGFAAAGNAVLACVYGTNPRTNTEVALQYRVRACETLETLLDSDIDAVYIASPVFAHRDQVLACARAGKHVLCEKPLGLNVAEAEEMVSACKEAGVLFGTAFMMRFNSQHQAVARLVSEGKLGKLVYARAQLSCWYPPLERAWRQTQALAGGGALIDMGSHCLDLLEMFLGPISTVSCNTNRIVHTYETEDSAVVSCRFANGALGTVDTFFCIRDDSCRNALELYGSHGSILATGTIGQGSAGEMSAFLEADAAYAIQQDRGLPSGVTIAPEPVNTYRAEIEAFSSAVLGQTPNVLDSGVGLRSQRVVAACYESAATGQSITVQ